MVIFAAITVCAFFYYQGRIAGFEKGLNVNREIQDTWRKRYEELYEEHQGWLKDSAERDQEYLDFVQALCEGQGSISEDGVMMAAGPIRMVS